MSTKQPKQCCRKNYGIYTLKNPVRYSVRDFFWLGVGLFNMIKKQLASYLNRKSQMNPSQSASAKTMSSDVRSALISIGRALGTVSVYGADHPSVDLIVSTAFNDLLKVLEDKKSLLVGSINGALSIDSKPVEVRDIPVRTLEKRLVALNISQLSLHNGLSESELKNLVNTLAAPSGGPLKDAFSSSDAPHISIEDVKYVALQDGEKVSGKGEGSGDGDAPTVPQAQVQQIVAFLKGNSSASDTDVESLKDSIADPAALGKMILEAAAIRQSGVDVANGENLADIVIGCLRRTYDGLRDEKEFQSVRGKANLAKAMMLLEKNVLDRIHRALSKQNPQVDARILDAIREMEEDRQFDLLTSQYFDQTKKLDKIEDKVVAAIRKQGANKAKEIFKESGLPPGEWHRLMAEAGEESPARLFDSDAGGTAPVDLSALAIVLEKIDHLMEIDQTSPEQFEKAVSMTQQGIQEYTNSIETRIQELEGQIEVRERNRSTLENHAEHMSREELILEVSNIALALIQPLTVVNASLESALHTLEPEMHNELLQLAHLSGERMESLTRRIMKLVGYPAVEYAKTFKIDD
jgi:hypothetical protein